MAASNEEIRQWAREQGIPVNDRGRVRRDVTDRFYETFPDQRPAGAVALLPSPEEAWADDGDYEDMGLAEPDSGPEPPPPPRTYQAVPDGPETPSADPEPAHGKKSWRQKTRGERAASPGKVGPKVRTDINAKISLVLEVPGRVWEARDPVCGGTFVQQRPDIADALTEIVCQSPDLVAWFAGSGGMFMLWLNLIMATWPVVTVAMAHHVYHSLEEPDATQPDYQPGQYAA